MGVGKTYQTGPKRVEVLKSVDFTVATGETVSIIGASGTGKSTFLHILGTIDKPSTGQVFFKDQELTSSSDTEQARFRSQHLGFVFQFHHLLPEFTALENVEMPLFLQRQSATARRELALQALEDVGLKGKEGQHPSELSGGEQQRVAVARAIVAHPAVLLADEPTGNLDRTTGEQLMDLLFSLNRDQGLTLIYVTHNESLATRAARRLELKDGMLH